MEHTGDSSVAQIFGVVHGVRRRWRWARTLRGAAIAVAGVLASLVIAALILDAARYAPGAVIAARVIVGLVSVGLIAYFVVLPLLPRPHDEQVALYVEEHEPSFEGALVSAVEVSHPRSPLGASSIAALVRRMALDRSRAVDAGRRVDVGGLRNAALALGAITAAMVLAVMLGPDGLRTGMTALLRPWESAELANPLRLDVQPGNATVARGASVVVSARAVGFQPESAELLARSSDTSAWTRIPMTADSARRFAARLLDVAVSTEYMVESNGLRSRLFRLNVANLPYTKRVDLEYHYPAYTRLPVQHVDSTGDIAALAGTTVRVRVTPTMPTQGGRLVTDRGDTLRLTANPDGTLAASLRVARPGFYRVELESARGDLLTASLDYSIDVLPDRPPSVRFTRPGRDSRVLAVDEVFSEARAEDDYGVAKLELVYSVNGSAERSSTLHESTARAIREIAAGHTFMLEDYALEPGDVVSYYARATDNDAVAGGKRVTSDIYFLQVRPYSQEYRQAQEGGGQQGGGGGGGEQPGQFSQRQREIIAGTFNATRDSASSVRSVLEEDLATLRLSQQRLREEVEQLARRLVERGVTSSDSNLARIAEILPVAAAAMDTVEKTLADGRLRDALRPEQRALQQLQRAEAVFRNVQVSMGAEGGGGGGGGAANAEDLADLFELQKERMRNQYETVQRGQAEEQRANEEVDATAERLRQLAARQQQENERARRKADSLGRMGASGTSGGDSQRQLAQEVEQTARQLERLARERESQSLADAARRMDQAADAMRRSASARGERAAADAATATDRLREARRLLDQERDNRAQRAVDEAAATGSRLAEEQRRVNEEVARQSTAQPDERDRLQRAIADRKGAMADSARALATRLDRASLDAQRDQPAVGRALAGAADTLRKRRIEDKLRVTRERVRSLSPEQQQGNEQIITDDIDQLNRALEAARRTSRETREADGGRRAADAAERARDLVRGMESLDERSGQQGQQGQEGPQGQAGQQRGQGGQGGPGGGQMGRELRQRLNDARALRRDLGGRGVDLTELDRAIGRLERLATPGSLSDPRAERALRGQIVEGLRSFEFVLGRTLGGTKERVLVDRTGEIPPEYRRYVEEYYRALGRAKPK
jgi:hypothetical protein